MNRFATRCTMTSPASMLKFSSDSLPSSLRTKIAGKSEFAANRSRVWTPSSEAATGLKVGGQKYKKSSVCGRLVEAPSNCESSRFAAASAADSDGGGEYVNRRE